MNKLEFVFYFLIAFTLIFLLSMRAKIKLTYIYLSQRLMKLYQENYFQIIEESLKTKHFINKKRGSINSFAQKTNYEKNSNSRFSINSKKLIH